jgi:integrase
LGSWKVVPGWTKLHENTREAVLERDEYARLKKYWLERNRYYWDITSFVQNMGVRYPSEVNKLEWKGVNLSKSYMVVRDRKGKPPTDMTVPLVGTTKKVLERLQVRPNIAKGPNDYVFVNDKGRRVKNIRKAFHNSLVKCGIDKDLSMYSLRHKFTTRLVKTRPDIPLKVIASILGHKDTRMIDKHYGHLRIEDVVHILKRSEKAKQRILKE